MSMGYSYLKATYEASGTLRQGERNVSVTPGTRIAGLPSHTFKLSADWHVAPGWSRSAATCWPCPTAACWATRTAYWKTRSPARRPRPSA